MGHGYAFVNLQNIFGNKVVDVKSLGLAEASEKQLLEYSLQKGDVLFVRSSVKLEGVGEAALVAETLENTTYSGFIIRFRDEYGLNNDFKKFVFATKKVRDQIMSQATNSANKNISQSVLENLTFEITSKDEQKQIGEYFSNLDSLITLHQCKCDYLIRLKCWDFSSLNKTAWEQRKVQDVADRFDNLRIPVAANLRVHGKTPYYGANGIQDYVDGFTHDGEFVLVAEDGANDLKNYPVKCVNGRIWVNNHAHVLQGKAGIADNSFLAFAISQSDIESLLVGGGRAKLNAETLMSIEFRLPCLQEQHQIGEYLTRLDHLITLHQRLYFWCKLRLIIRFL